MSHVIDAKFSDEVTVINQAILLLFVLLQVIQLCPPPRGATVFKKHQEGVLLNGR